MRLVADTNVVVSGLLWTGAPARLLDTLRDGDATGFTSRPLLAELTRILRREKLAKIIAASHSSVDDLVLGYTELTTVLVPQSIEPVIVDDPDDDQILACALAAEAELIVSGDRHLLDLENYQDIPIVKPAEALTMIVDH